MKPKKLIIVCVIVILIAGIGFAVAKIWKGSGAGEAAEDVRDQVTGRRVIDQGEDLKRQLSTVNENQKSQYDSINQ